MVNLASWHNWIAILAIVLLGGFLLRQAGTRIPMVGRVVSATIG